tara:strand:+ start:10308 stop:11693 length:1386 start_codon:yes stop_codon:yes gene_type:complete
MKKKNILINKEQLVEMKKNLNEAPPIDYGDGDERMDPTLQNRLETGDFPGAGSEAFPEVPEDGIPNTFEELIASKRFKDVVNTVKHYTGVRNVTPNSFMQLQQMLMGAVQRIFQIESQNKEQLEELAVKIVKEQLSIPDDALQFDAKIVGMGEIDMSGMKGGGEQEQQQQQNAEEEAAEEFEDFDIEKEKRRFLNQLIQGASKKGHYMFHLVEEDLNSIDSDLINLYGVMMSVNDLVYWIMPDETTMMMAQSGQGMAGKEEVDPDTDPPTVKAQGITFPVLVHELIKGVMEVLATQGLPDDPRQAQMVMDSEDTLVAEIWDLRLGPVIWEKFREAYPYELMEDDKLEVQNFLFSEFARMDAKELFRLSKNILAGNEEGKEGLRDIVKGILEEMKNQNYEDSETDSDYESDVMTASPVDDTEPTPTRPSLELDMDDILDKIFSQGMDSLTREEKAFLQSQSR